METYRITVKPLTAFGTPILGETMFGQLCWAYRYLISQDELKKALAEYCEGKPFMVVSDAFPAGYLPMPQLPWMLLTTKDIDIKHRKKLKKLEWLRFEAKDQSLQMLRQEKNAASSNDLKECFSVGKAAHVHATLNRLNSTTGGDPMFAPYTKYENFYSSNTELEFYVNIDEVFVNEKLLESLLSYLAKTGYGRDVSAGLGKFEVVSVKKISLSRKGQSFLSLASCSPYVDGLDVKKCFYKTKTHFGRLGDVAVFGGNPFKQPVLLAKSGAVLTFNKTCELCYVGRGLKGVSAEFPEIVHQGYAPIVPIDYVGKYIYD